MQILLNSLKVLSLLFSSPPLLTGDELWPPLPELAGFFTSAEATFDGGEGFGFPNGRVD